jgi:outer membrane immunogenic protein
VKRPIAMGFGALALVAAGAASAADLPIRPAPPAPIPVVYNWTGFYIGANGGGAWANKCWDFAPAVGVPVREGCHNANGGVVGGQVGFNWQTGAFVWGVELAGDWAFALSGSNDSLVFVAPQNTNRSRVDGIASVTGRIGYAVDATLFYFKGGGAWASDKYDSRITATGVLTASASETRTGWTVGGGFEYGFTPNWSVGLEVDHFDFGRRNVNFIGPGAGVDRIDQTVEMVTVRLNWRFGWGGGRPLLI